MKREAYYTTKIQNDLVFKYCGYEICTPEFIHHPHMRSEYLIHYIKQGSGYYICSGIVHPIMQGDLFLIPPQKLVSYYTNPEDPFVFSWFAFSGTKSGDVMQRLGFTDSGLVRKLHSQYSISQLIETLTDLINSPAPYDDFSTLELLYGILSRITASYHLSSSYTADRSRIIPEHINKAKSYIKFNYMGNITPQTVSDYVGLERSYFSKIFRKYTGRTTQRYIMEIRIQQAKNLLETTDYTISQISSYVGIADVYYFSRAFRQITGMPPSQYRKEYIQTPG